MLTQVGTYFWHAHSKSLRAEGMTGALIIEDTAEDFQYDEERTLMLTDWWHEQVRVLAAGLAQKTFRWVGDPASVLTLPAFVWSQWGALCRHCSGAVHAVGDVLFPGGSESVDLPRPSDAP
jgi:FtsP/CotA-like multicopper oxidase with cupredoxin domain